MIHAKEEISRTLNLDFEKLLSKYSVKLINVECKEDRNAMIVSNQVLSQGPSPLQPNHFVNQHVKRVYIINLRSNVHRRNYVTLLMRKYNIRCTLVVVDEITDTMFSALNRNNVLSKGEAGCLVSHLWCLKQIIDQKIENAIIFEDDVILHKNFLGKFEEIVNIRKYDLLMLGACDFSFSKIHKAYVTNGVYQMDRRAKRVYGAHAIYYSLAGAAKMFETKTRNGSITFFDNNYYEMFSFFPSSAYICYPNLVVADLSTSNLNHHFPFLSGAEENYYSQCFCDFSFQDYNFIYLDLLIKSPSISFEVSENYSSCIRKLLYYYFYNTEKALAIKSRMVMNFFTVADLKEILRTGQRNQDQSVKQHILKKKHEHESCKVKKESKATSI